MENNKRPIKIILVGNTGVGKTCLIGSYLKKHFDEDSLSTLSPAYSTQQYTKSDGTIVSIQIWDTAGQEKYHAVSQLFFRNSDIAIMCFVAGDKDSMSAIHEWIEMVLNESPQCRFIFVATKSDLIEKEKHDGIIQDAEAEFQQYHPLKIFMTSSKENDSVDKVFQLAGELGEVNSNEPAKEMEVEHNKKSCC